MFADQYGVEITPVCPVEMTDETVSRIQDAMIIKWKKIGLSTRWIGKILRMDHSTVVKRYQAIPERVRAHYVSVELDRLGAA